MRRAVEFLARVVVGREEPPLGLVLVRKRLGIKLSKIY